MVASEDDLTVFFYTTVADNDSTGTQASSKPEKATEALKETTTTASSLKKTNVSLKEAPKTTSTPKKTTVSLKETPKRTSVLKETPFPLKETTSTTVLLKNNNQNKDSFKEQAKTTPKPIEEVENKSKEARAALIKETEDLDALFEDVETARNRGEKDFLLSSGNGKFDKCNVCQGKKPKTQPWVDHNISEDHIAALIQHKGFGKAVNNLSNFCNFLRIYCDICGTWFNNGVLFQAHKFHKEHQLRISDVLQWSRAAKKRGIARGNWNRISKPDKITPKQISDGLKFIKTKNQRK